MIANHKFIIYKPIFIMLGLCLLLFINMSIFDYILRINIGDKPANEKKEDDKSC